MEAIPNSVTSEDTDSPEVGETEVLQFPEQRSITIRQLEAETTALTRFRKKVPEGEVGVRVWVGEHKTIMAVGSAAAVLTALGALGVGAHYINKHRQNRP